MRIYILNAGRLIKFLIVLLIIIGIVITVYMFKPDSLEVWSSKREIPIYSVQCNDKKVSITFDCAWGSDDIPDILNTLKKADVKATFFIVGQWAEKYPDKVRMIAEDGHDVANHSYSHLRMGALDREKITSEIELCGQKLTSITGRKIELFRAPFGDYSNNVVKIARQLGYFTIQWDVDSLDWKPDISKETIISRVSTKTKPGSIILFHNDTTYTAKILGDIIECLKKEGYQFVPVSKLIMRENYEIDFEGKQKIREK